MRHRFLAILHVLGLAAALAAQTPPLPADRATGGETITAQDLQTWLTRLASPEFAGRGTGQPGFQKAAEYVRDHFATLGLEPAGDAGTFFQAVPWTKITADPTGFTFRVQKDGRTLHEIALGDVRGTIHGKVEGKGNGFVAVVSDLDDPPLQQVDLEGKAVFLLVTDGSERSERARTVAINRLMRAAREEAGASVVVLVDDPTFAAFADLSGPSVPGANPAASGLSRRGPSSIVIARATFDRLAAALGTTPEKFTQGKGVLPLDADVELAVATAKGQAPAYNVVAVLPGSDPKLKAEHVVIGCHLDHLGKRDGRIWPGADDDGSGSAGLMAIARAFAKNGRAPRRSVLFAAFCGEENGLIGSAFFARKPPIELSRMVAELQIDMIGRDEETGTEQAADNKNTLHLIGTEKLSQDLHDLCLRLNEDRARFTLEWDEEDVFYRSDHWSFAKHGVPIAFFFTGFHRDYHQPSDTVEKINFAKLARVSRYVYDIGFELADQEQRPLVEADKWERLAQKGAKEPAAPLRKE